MERNWNYEPPLDELLEGDCGVLRKVVRKAGFKKPEHFREMLAETAERIAEQGDGDVDHDASQAGIDPPDAP
jgi:hypothetical protein